MSKIIYLPGLNSDKNSRKFQIINDFFGKKYDYVFVDWQGHHYIPALLNAIKREYTRHGCIIIGDSTGANFACQLRDSLDSIHNSYLVLLSPLLDGDSIKVKVDFAADVKDHLKKITPKNAMIIYGENDEIINFSEVDTQEYSGVKLLKVNDTHRLEHFEQYLPTIKSWIEEIEEYKRRKGQFSGRIKGALLGMAVGDALGVPVEFEDRSYLKENPVTDLISGGTHNQRSGTFSDDSSLAFCLAENLAEEYDIEKIADNFVKWYKEGYWSARGEVFDIGIATLEALERIISGTNPLEAGGKDEYSNGNGSLMRILPLLFYINEKSVEERFVITREVSSITHAHIRSVICCFYYLEFARYILEGKNFSEAFTFLRSEFPEVLKSLSVPEEEITNLKRLFSEDFKDLPEDQIQSSGYVVHTLEASIWCLLNTETFREAVLKAVNLGDDTDTTGCVTGGLAGLHYGFLEFGKRWTTKTARRYDIINLGSKLTDKYFKK